MATFFGLPDEAQNLIVSNFSISDAIRFSLDLGPDFWPGALPLVRTAKLPPGCSLSFGLGGALCGLHVLHMEKVYKLNPGIILPMRQLQELKMSDCGLTWSDMNVIATSTLKDTLTVLDLSNPSPSSKRMNHVGDAGAGCLVHLTRLQQLSLAENGIGTAGAASIAQLTTLKQLDLGSNDRIGHAGADYLTSLTQLTRLDMKWCGLEDSGTQSLAQITSLRCLNVSGNDITDEGAAYLTSLTLLQQLDLSGNQISAAGAKALAQLTLLQELDLAYVDVGDEGLVHLAALPGLRTLDLSGTSLTHVGLRALTHVASTLEGLAIGLHGGASAADKALNYSALAHMTNLTALTMALEAEAEAEVIEETIWLANLTRLQQLRINIPYDLRDAAAAAGLGALVSLTELKLSGTMAPAAMVQLTKLVNSLVTLDLSGFEPEVDGILLAQHLTALTGLTQLNVTYNKLGPGGAEYVGRLTSLRELRILYNGLGPSGAAHLTRLTNLAMLDIGCNDLGAAGAAEVAKMRSLRWLDISFNDLGAAGAVELAALTGLTSLMIQSNQLGAAGLRHLTALTNLAELRAVRIGEEGEAIVELMKSLPRCPLNSPSS